MLLFLAVLLFLLGAFLGLLFAAFTVVSIALALGLQSSLAIPGMLGAFWLLLPVVGPLVAPLVAGVLAFVVTPLVAALVLFVIWLVVGVVVTAVPYAVAALTVFGPQGARSGPVPEPPVAYLARCTMTGFSLGANVTFIMLLGGVAAALSVLPPFPLLSLLALVSALIALVTHVVFLLPGVAAAPWARSLTGWSGWLMPLTWPAQAFGAVLVALNGIGVLAGSPFRFRMMWGEGAPVFAGGWAGAFLVAISGGGAVGMAPGNFCIMTAATERDPPPFGRPAWARVSIAAHEIGHVLHTAVLGTFFLLLDAIEENLLGRFQLAYGELLAESRMRRSAVYWASRVRPIPWVPVLGTAPNALPVALIEGPVAGSVGDDLQFDGSVSSDPDAYPLPRVGFRWSLRTDPDVGFPDDVEPPPFDRTDLPMVTFTPDTPGRFTIQLDVHDGAATGPRARRCVGIDIPVATITGPATTEVGTQVDLDGAGSTDAAGAGLDYRWDLVSVPPGSGALMVPTAADGSAVAFTPDVAGRYDARLVVENGDESCPALHTVLAECVAPAGAPVATISAPATALMDAPVPLTASVAADPADGPLSFAWSFVERPVGSTAAPPAGDANAAFLPDVPGRYRIGVAVSNDAGTGCPAFHVLDVFTVAARALTVSRPDEDVVAATEPSPNPLSLTASPTVLAGGAPLQVAWTLEAVPPGSALVPGTSAAGPTFQVQPDVGGTYLVRYVVTDPSGVVRTRGGWLEDVRPPAPTGVTTRIERTGTVSTVTSSEPRRATVHVGTPSHVRIGFLSSLAGPNTLRWRFESVPPTSQATLDAPAGIAALGATFVPDLPGRYVVSLRVANTNGVTSPRLFVFDVVDR